MPKKEVTKANNKIRAKHDSKKPSGGARGNGKKQKGGEMGGSAKVLAVLASLRRKAGIVDAPRKQVAAMAQIKPTTLAVVISKMKQQDLIEYPSKDTVRITEKGLAMAPTTADSSSTFEFAADNSSVHDDIKKNYLKNGATKVRLFDALADGASHDKNEIMKAIGYENKASFAVLLSNIKKLGIVEYPDRQSVRLAGKLALFFI